MADDSQPYTPEELAALEDMHEPETLPTSLGRVVGHCTRCRVQFPCPTVRLIHQLRQQTARAEAAEDQLNDKLLDLREMQGKLSAIGNQLAKAVADAVEMAVERDAARTVIAIMDSKYKECQRELEARTAAYNLADRERDAYQEQLSDARTARAERDLDVQALTAERDIVNRALAKCEQERDQACGMLGEYCAERNQARTALAAAERDLDYIRTQHSPDCPVKTTRGDELVVAHLECGCFTSRKRQQLEKALAAAEVERARLAHWLQRFVELRAAIILAFRHGSPDVDRTTINEVLDGGEEALLAASPHADLVAVRNLPLALDRALHCIRLLVKGSPVRDVAETLAEGDAAIRALPSWCREQP